MTEALKAACEKLVELCYAAHYGNESPEFPDMLAVQSAGDIFKAGFTAAVPLAQAELLAQQKQIVDDLIDCRAQRDEEKARSAKLLAALKWYAESNNWADDNPGPYTAGDDCGRIAIRAIAEYEKG